MTKEEIQKLAEERYPVPTIDDVNGRYGDLLELTNERAVLRAVFILGYTEYQSDKEKFAQEKVEELNKQISDILIKLDRSGRKESIIGALRVEYIPWQRIISEFKEIGITVESPF